MEPISYWHDSLEPGDTLEPRAALPGDCDADVAIVGGGFTGLWTAYYLLRADPTLRVVVLERDTAGFGASGRNGGWCVGDHAAAPGALEKEGGNGAAAATILATHDAVDEVGEVTRREGIDCGYHKGGALYLCSNPVQLRRMQKKHEAEARYGFEHGEMLDAAATREKVRADGILGSFFTPHAAALNPARLARGVARAIERLGGAVHEGTAVRSISPGLAVTEHGTVRAEVVVRALEAYTPTLDGHERTMLPLANYVIATEPIDDAVWAEIGLADRELFEDSRLLLGYGNRTADGRIVWGGMAAPSFWRNRVPEGQLRSPKVDGRLRDLLVQRFPVLRDVRISHRWSGVLGVPRDLRPSVGLDRTTGLAWGGGYFGAGVASANHAGQTLADLITGADTDRVRLPWVDHRSRRWEPEPIRWVGVRTAVNGAKLADRIDPHRR